MLNSRVSSRTSLLIRYPDPAIRRAESNSHPYNSFAPRGDSGAMTVSISLLRSLRRRRVGFRFFCRVALLCFLLGALAANLSANTPLPTPGNGDTIGEQPRQLSLKARQGIFEKVWREINEDYYDPEFNGVNWDAIRSAYRPRVSETKNDA